MEAIKEDYVSFEVAKLLKEKGFNEDCRDSYDWGGNFHLNTSSNNGSIKKIAAPTLQMAMKWLREVHEIYMMIDKDFATEKGWHYVIARKQDWADNIDKGLIQQESNSYTYEEACEAAIKYCLENLI